jgi:hypothetical protein
MVAIGQAYRSWFRRALQPHRISPDTPDLDYGFSARLSSSLVLEACLQKPTFQPGIFRAILVRIEYGD